MKKRTIVLILLAALFVSGARADAINSLRLSEVAVGDSLEHSGWVEIQNTSWGTQNLGGFYITNNPAALDETLTPPQRMQYMHLIPTGNPLTSVAPQNCLLLYADGHDNIGILHLNFTLQPGDIVAIYNGNGKDLVDSLTIPLFLKPNQSWAKDFSDGKWAICGKPTPTLANNYEQAKRNNKIAEFKEKDPYGIAMAIMAMGIVFACLILLYVFFKLFGYILNRQSANTNDDGAKVNGKGAIANAFCAMVNGNGAKVNGKNAKVNGKNAKVNGKGVIANAMGAIAGSNAASSATSSEEKVAALMAVADATAGTGSEQMDMALIALALEDELAHDEESGVITIQRSPSPWADKALPMEEGLLRP